MTPSLRQYRFITRFWIVLAAAVLLISGCTVLAQDNDPQSTDSAENTGGEHSSAPAPTADPKIGPVPKAQWKRMQAAGMVRPECPLQDPTKLRVVTINHYDFDGDIERGRLVVNADVADSLARIFTRLFDEQFPIERMNPVEAFDGDTNASLRANNTSAFNCRRADQINAPFADSPHANGRAIDINPVQNPWLDLRCDCWLPSAEYRKRVDRPGAINKRGLVWQLFEAEGWIWQNIDVPDYMHFDTGYPSAPFTGAPDA